MSESRPRKRKAAKKKKKKSPRPKPRASRRKFSQEQYKMLNRCSKQKDMTEWNEWREANPDVEVQLQGADLQRAELQQANLQGADLRKANLLEANLRGANLQGADIHEASLQGAILSGANLQRAKLQSANLQGAYFSHTNLRGAELEDAKVQGAYLFEANLQDARARGAKLQGADLEEANLQDAHLGGTNLQDADLLEANLQHADLRHANLQGANLFGAVLQGAALTQANLQNADLEYADLEGAYLRRADLQAANLRRANLHCADLVRANLRGADLTIADLKGTDFCMAAVDGETIIDTRKIDGDTNFTGVGLDSACVEPALKQLLKYNIRRRRWREWYEVGPQWKRFIKTALVQPFWWISDYGRSTGQIIGCFFALAVLFAAVYYVWGLLDPPGIVDSLFETRHGSIPGGFVPLRAIYLSVVTMTTLGFGDMHTIARGVWGHGLLMLQVLLGYVLLAALVARFAVLFTAGGPTGRFGDEKTAWQRVKEKLRINWIPADWVKSQRKRQKGRNK